MSESAPGEVQQLAVHPVRTSSGPAAVDTSSAPDVATVKVTVATSATAVARSSSAASSPVSDLAHNLEVLSTDGFVSQGSSSADG